MVGYLIGAHDLRAGLCLMTSEDGQLIILGRVADLPLGAIIVSSIVGARGKI